MAFNNNSPDIDAAEAFSDIMTGYLENYDVHLEKTLTKSTVGKHSSLIAHFIDELCNRYTVTALDQITPGMCGSKLVRSYNSHSGDNLQLLTAKFCIFSG